MSDNCVYCGEIVRPRQQALQCDFCGKWQHRTCNTGMSQDEYRRLVSSQKTFSYTCSTCVGPTIMTAAKRGKDQSSTSQPLSKRHSNAQVPIDSIDSTSTGLAAPPNTRASSNPTDPDPLASSPTGAKADSINGIPPLLDRARPKRKRKLPAKLLHSGTVADPTLSKGRTKRAKTTNIPDDDQHTAKRTPPCTLEPSLFERSEASALASATNALTEDVPKVPPFYEVPVPHDESSLNLSSTSTLISETSNAPRFVIITDGSNKGKPCLIDTHGFKFVIKERSSKAITWRCSVRSKTKDKTCYATVRQEGEVYIEGLRSHTHTPLQDVLQSVSTIASIKKTASENVFQPAQHIVEKAVVDVKNFSSLPKLPALVRRANRVRANGRPKHPQSLDFTLNEQLIPTNFLRGDLVLSDQRHLLFATKVQLDLLWRSKRWFCDGTFKAVRTPFHQLFGIHAFIRHSGEVKQVPLLFAVMSRRTTLDYTEVFQKLLEQFPTTPCVKEFVIDFEKALWTAIAEIFPSATRKGCAFHWAQAVWRRIQELGLQRSFTENSEVKRFCRYLFALPLVPGEVIPFAFDIIKQKSTEQQVMLAAPRFDELLAYVHKNWITSTIWPPSSWSVFMQHVRTNNDAEGWHNRFHHRIQQNHLNLYVLVDALHEEAGYVSLQMDLLSQGKIRREMRQKARNVQANLELTWEQYNEKQLDTWALVKRCSSIYCPKTT